MQDVICPLQVIINDDSQVTATTDLFNFKAVDCQSGAIFGIWWEDHIACFSIFRLSLLAINQQFKQHMLLFAVELAASKDELAKVQGQQSGGSKNRVETDRQTKAIA